MNLYELNNGAFYSVDEGGSLFYGPNYVLGPGFELRRELKDTYEYPVHGWFWFDSNEEAIAFFNLGDL